MRMRVLAVVAVAMALAGCGGVMLSAKYSQLLDQTAALSQATATRAAAGQLSQDEETKSLQGQAAVWQMFRDARDGKGSN